ncbi:single-stranded DNA-binding protein [Erysipelothrix sp. D19-032]
MINYVVLTGRLTRNPELRKTQTGKSVVSFNLAVQRKFSQQGEEKQSDFVNCVAWNKTKRLHFKLSNQGIVNRC